MGLLGGGAFQLAPGQVTDDGELTICTARGLIDCGKHFDLEKVAHSVSNNSGHLFNLSIRFCGITILI